MLNSGTNTPIPVAAATVAAATAFPAATEAALEVLREGGNAVDGAVAAAWALGVCEPSGSGLGGQTILMVRFGDGRTTVVDGHSYAPASASLETISPAEQRTGYRAATIPSTPATLAYAQGKYGALPAARVLDPAIRLACEGYEITSLQSLQAKWTLSKLREFPAAARLFLKDGCPPPAGYRLRQPELAATLKRLASEGCEDFYRGEIARQIADDMREHGGLLSESDLAELGPPEEREPLVMDYRGYQVLSAPPPGGGFQVLLALKVLEQFPPEEFASDADRWYELAARTVYAVFYERERRALTCDELAGETREWLSDDWYVRQVAALTDSVAAEPAFAAAEGPGETTHLTVADARGNVVSLTQSIQSLFGAKAANAKLGFLYNNYLHTCPRTPHPCQLASRVRPRSNAAPTIVLKEGRPVLALGAAGSRRITSSIFETISGVVDRGMPLAEAVAAPRVHALLNGKVWIEAPALTERLGAELARGFTEIRVRKPHHFWMGSVQGIQFSEDGRLHAAADPRRDGFAAEDQLPFAPERKKH